MKKSRHPDKRPAMNPPRLLRYSAVDVLRGCAVVLMVAYHFSFDLDYYGLLRIDFHNQPFWLDARAFIVTLFLGTAGISLVLANRNAVNWRSRFRRIGILAGCAALVSAASYFLFPNSWIFFGVLHFIALASLLALPFLRWHWPNLLAGLALLVIGLSIALPAFDHPWLQWFGLMTYKPITEDYVPLLPWFGVVLIGIFLGRFLLNQAGLATVRAWQPRGKVSRWIAFAGRHSLVIYMLHQPLLMGALYLVMRMVR